MTETQGGAGPSEPRDVGEFDGYGHVPGIGEGQIFSGQDEAADLKVHRDHRGGIVGSRKRGAESIVVSGGYEDDEDDGEVLIYTGQGGRKGPHQVCDQKLTSKNESLRTSWVNKRPVRVIRAINPRRSKSGKLRHDGYRYDGLYIVEDFWQTRGRSGFLVYKSLLVKITDPPSMDVSRESSLTSPNGNANPGRQVAVTQRIVRSTKIAEWVKKEHDYKCQVCEVRLSSGVGAYAEAAHIRPLGTPHNGPDSTDNVLCLCPNHHVLFDLGMLSIDDDLLVTRIDFDEPATPLRDLHPINREHLRYHRRHHEELRKHVKMSRLRA